MDETPGSLPTANDREFYQSPLVVRYGSDDMKRKLGDDAKFRKWREMWLAIARAQKALGLPITDRQLEEIANHLVLSEQDYQIAADEEAVCGHDLVAHLRSLRAACPEGGKIAHLGCTTCDVGDNVDLMTWKECLASLLPKLARVMDRFAGFADQYKDMPAVGYTHIKEAQMVTIGKRACLWLADLFDDMKSLEFLIRSLRFRGMKGATGTQASFLALFDGDGDRVDHFEKLVALSFDFEECYPITGQTYRRKVDVAIMNVLAGLGATVHKIGMDLRFMQHLNELREGRPAGKVSSSAMAFKQNPTLAERICSLGRFLMNSVAHAYTTLAAQMMERTLDDSAIRRIYLPEALLAADGILDTMQYIAEGIRIFPAIIDRNARTALPFIATEEILGEMVKLGLDRQQCHENIRKLSEAAIEDMLEKGKDNDLLERIKNDPYFKPVEHLLPEILEPARFVGRAPIQVERFLADYIRPALIPYADQLAVKAVFKV
jgi:adenylosuccinate lyase